MVSTEVSFRIINPPCKKSLFFNFQVFVLYINKLIYLGNDEVKRGVLLMLFGGVPKVTTEKTNLRGDRKSVV